LAFLFIDWLEVFKELLKEPGTFAGGINLYLPLLAFDIDDSFVKGFMVFYCD